MTTDTTPTPVTVERLRPYYKHPLYKVWQSMVDRCHNPKKACYARYGGRGIKVCDKWRGSFPEFVADVGPRPNGTTLDRFPNMNGDYEPGNTRWATPADQNRNSRVAVFVEHGGESHCLKDWASKLGVSYTTFKSRVLMRGASEAIRVSLLIGANGNLRSRMLRLPANYKAGERS